MEWPSIQDVFWNFFFFFLVVFFNTAWFVFLRFKDWGIIYKPYSLSGKTFITQN